MATNHNSYCNTEIVADQPQLVSFLAKNPAKKTRKCLWST